MMRAIAFWNEKLDGVAEEVLAVVTEHRFGECVHRDDVTARIDDDDRVGGNVEKGLELRVELGGRRFGWSVSCHLHSTRTVSGLSGPVAGCVLY